MGRRSKARGAREATVTRLRAGLAASLDPARGGLDDAWVGLEPTFVSRKASSVARAALAAGDPVRRELEAFVEGRERYLAQRPVWSPTRERPPWHGL